MTSYSLTLTKSKVIEIQKLLKNHSLYEILDNIHTSLDEREADDYGELGSWGFTIQCVANTYESRRETMTQYAESWLWLGELRNIVRMVCNANPSTEEEDEIYFRDHPEQIPIAFETFIGSVLFNLIGISSIN